MGGSNSAVGYTGKSRKASSQGEYRKDSTDRQSLITQALFQEAQRDRIRAADRDGKDEIVYLQANATTRDPMQVRVWACGHVGWEARVKGTSE